MNDDTVLLRLAGPMQSWGTGSRFQIRRTDPYPSKSGVIGLLLCAMGVRREDAPAELPELASLAMGVRVDMPGTVGWDYHTAGGGHDRGEQRAIGIRSADGKIKRTSTTKLPETLLSRREYLWDASFLVALRGDPASVARVADALDRPVWPVFLGRKCCIPSEPVFVRTGRHDSLNAALSSLPWTPMVAGRGGFTSSAPKRLDCYVECAAGEPARPDARMVHDVPQALGVYGYAPRFVARDSVTVPVGEPRFRPPARPEWRDPYGPGWPELRERRLEQDHGLCVFCKERAVEVHHLDYTDVRIETLRSLCGLCHKACTSMEYSRVMRQRRIDPQNPASRDDMLRQIERLLGVLRPRRVWEIRAAARASGGDFFADAR